MADMKTMDTEAGHTVINAFSSNTDFLNTMFSALQTNSNNLLETWNGTSKTQFEGAWSDFTAAVNTLKQSLDTMKNNLQYEVRQVEETFAS